MLELVIKLSLKTSCHSKHCFALKIQDDIMIDKYLTMFERCYKVGVCLNQVWLVFLLFSFVFVFLLFELVLVISIIYYTYYLSC